jgi:lipopolysaccharide export LptBFGC system permease protein LptF
MIIKTISKYLLLLLVVISVLSLVIIIYLSIWLSSYSTYESKTYVADITTKAIVQNIDGSTNFVLVIDTKNQNSSLGYIFDKNNQKEGEKLELFMNGDNYTLTLDHIIWSKFLSDMGIKKSYRFVETGSNYTDSSKLLKYGFDTYPINGGSDEMLKSISNERSIADPLVDSIKKISISDNASNKEITKKLYIENGLLSLE